MIRIRDSQQKENKRKARNYDKKKNQIKIFLYQCVQFIRLKIIKKINCQKNEFGEKLRKMP